MKYLFLLLICSNVSAQNFMSRNISAEFKQQVVSKVSKRIKESDISMKYSYPGKFNVKAVGKDDFVFLSNGATSWYYRPPFIAGEMGEVTIGSVSSLKFLRVFDALYKGEKTSGYFSEKKQLTVREFIFTKKIQKEIGINKIIFISTNKLNNIFDAKKIEIYNAKGLTTTLVVKKIEKASALPKSHFNFKIPKNTKVINRD